MAILQYDEDFRLFKLNGLRELERISIFHVGIHSFCNKCGSIYFHFSRIDGGLLLLLWCWCDMINSFAINENLT